MKYIYLAALVSTLLLGIELIIRVGKSADSEEQRREQRESRLRNNLNKAKDSFEFYYIHLLPDNADSSSRARYIRSVLEFESQQILFLDSIIASGTSKNTKYD